jgi:predicted murein hydrolase (TIGR00659 family)
VNEVVELWVYLSSSPLFGLTATLLAYVVAQAAYQRSGQAPLANPVLWSVVALAAALWLTGTPYPRYFAGAQFIHVLLGPAVVALAWPMWQRRAEMKARGGVLLAAALAGGAAAAASAAGLAWALGLPADVVASLAPKSVTAPVAMGIADRIGGVPALAAVFAVLTGVVGAVSGKFLFDRLRISDRTVRGFALGTAAHGIGSARALQVHPDAGAYAGLGLGIQILLASIGLPLVAWLLHRF